MTTHAAASLQARMSPQGDADAAGGIALGRMTLERATGMLHGRRGSYALQRTGTMNRGGALEVFPIAIALPVLWVPRARFVEWGVALAMGQGADEFLGTQGDPWDTQSDMFCALIGATVALLLLSRWPDRQIGPLPVTGAGASSEVA